MRFVRFSWQRDLSRPDASFVVFCFQFSSSLLNLITLSLRLIALTCEINFERATAQLSIGIPMYFSVFFSFSLFSLIFFYRGGKTSNGADSSAFRFHVGLLLIDSRQSVYL
jgi:hypothetical protein